METSTKVIIGSVVFLSLAGVAYFAFGRKKNQSSDGTIYPEPGGTGGFNQPPGKTTPIADPTTDAPYVNTKASPQNQAVIVVNKNAPVAYVDFGNIMSANAQQVVEEKPPKKEVGIPFEQRSFDWADKNDFPAATLMLIDGITSKLSWQKTFMNDYEYKVKNEKDKYMGGLFYKVLDRMFDEGWKHRTCSRSRNAGDFLNRTSTQIKAILNLPESDIPTRNLVCGQPTIDFLQAYANCKDWEAIDTANRDPYAPQHAVSLAMRFVAQYKRMMGFS